MSTGSHFELVRRHLIYNNLDTYLRTANWILVPHDNANYIVYQSPSEDSFKLVLSSSRTESHFLDRAVNAIGIIAEINSQSFIDAIFTVNKVDRDVAVHSIDVLEKESSISIETAYKVMHGFRNIIRFSSAFEHNPLKLLNASAARDEELNAVRLGHTVKSSFGFILEGALPSSSQQNMFVESDQAPAVRRIFERMARGFHFTAKAVENDSADVLIDKYKLGFNANLCEAARDVLENERKANVRFNFEWSPLYKVSSDVKEHSSIEIKPRAKDYLEYAAKELRRFEETQITFSAHVVALESDKPPASTTVTTTSMLYCWSC